MTDTGIRGVRREYVTYRGVAYYRYPDANSSINRHHYRSLARPGTPVSHLHRQLWTDYHGRSIPPDHDIYHIDGDHDNNRIENLGCLPHAEVIRRAVGQREPVPFTCTNCGASFTSTNHSSGVRYCSHACVMAVRRASGVEDEQRVCAWCTATFTANRTQPTRHCSRSCAQRTRQAARVEAGN